MNFNAKIVSIVHFLWLGLSGLIFKSSLFLSSDSSSFCTTWSISKRPPSESRERRAAGKDWFKNRMRPRRQRRCLKFCAKALMRRPSIQQSDLKFLKTVLLPQRGTRSTVTSARTPPSRASLSMIIFAVTWTCASLPAIRAQKLSSAKENCRVTWTPGIRTRQRRSNNVPTAGFIPGESKLGRFLGFQSYSHCNMQ